MRRGLLSARMLRGRAWQRLFRDVYADARLDRTHKLRCKAALAFLLPQGIVLAGRSAAHLLGVPYVAAEDPIEVLSRHKFGPVAGIKIHVGVVRRLRPAQERILAPDQASAHLLGSGFLARPHRGRRVHGRHGRT